ncbi:MAG TPA: sigma-70 family RNA polymerase sigma factor, partial [Solirubrobacteraceae bacterium]|nr:sigma-70 family RNA polymerase sigma factor [Solirubrobacteraceae bacterium]
HLVEAHLPLVRSVARRYVGFGESLDDLVQVGAVGLVKAGNRFDPRRGVTFAAFAAPVIEGEIRRYMRDRSAPMRIPRGVQRTRSVLRRKHDQLAATTGHSPSTRELAAALNLDENSVEHALRADLARTPRPLSGEDERRLEDSDDSGESEERLSLARCMRVLDERERKIVFLRFHADMTERQIGREVGISQAQVSRLLSAALARLRQELAGPESADSTGDTTAASVIPRDSGADITGDQPRKSARSASEPRKSAVNIGAVPASHALSTAADYLDLPYSVAVQAEREGDESRWTASVEELPGCAAQGRTPDEAVELLRGAMESWIEAALAQRREIPLPGDAAKQKTSSSHSGRFLVRMPAALHAQLAQAAEREHLSLNRFITKILTASTSPQTVTQQHAASVAKEAAGEQASAAGKPSRAFRIAIAVNVGVVVIAAIAAGVLLVLALQHGV